MPEAQSVNHFPKVYLARHGETAWTISRQHTGRTDLPLTSGGRREAEHVRERLADRGGSEGCPLPGTIFSSPLKRAWETGVIATGGAAMEAWDDLVEWDYGDYEGLTTREIQAVQPGWNIFVDGATGGESVEAIGVRADRVVERLRALKEPEVVLFSHGHFLRVLMARWLRQPVKAGAFFVLSTAAVVELGYEHDLDEPCIRF